MHEFLAEINEDLKTGNLEPALARCHLFLQNRPDNGVGHSQLARILLRLCRNKDAEAAAQTAMALDPQMALPYAIQISSLRLPRLVDTRTLAPATAGMAV